jgi:hypothetical protein
MTPITPEREAQFRAAHATSDHGSYAVVNRDDLDGILAALDAARAEAKAARGKAIEECKVAVAKWIKETFSRCVDREELNEDVTDVIDEQVKP